MGAKRTAKKQKATFNNNVNVVNFNSFQKKNQVNILPRNKHQETYVLDLLDEQKNIVFGIGPAGTGKTLLSVQVAIKKFKEGSVDKIVITRPAVSVDEDLGALPGTLEEKMAPWTRPVIDVLKEYFYSREIEGMIAEGIIEIAPLSYMRGRTFKNAFIVADECQLTTPNQMKMLLTRIGQGSQMAITGDLAQADRGSDNGLMDFLNKINKHPSGMISIIRFDTNDVERHPAVKEVLKIYGDE